MKLRVLLVLMVLPVSIAGAQTDPGCPGYLSSIQVNGPALPVAIGTDGILAVTKDSLGLTTWDVSDPVSPRRLGTQVGSRGWNDHIERVDFYLHPAGLAIGVPLLEIYDLRHPAHPEESWWDLDPKPAVHFSNYGGDDPWKGLAIRDDVIAAVHAETEIWLLDITELPPTAWTVPVWPNLPSRVVDVAVVGGHLVVLGWSGEVRVYSLEDLGSPSLVGTGATGSFAADWSLYGGGGVALAVSRINAMGSSAVETTVIDLADPTTPVVHDVTSQLQWVFVGRVELMGDGGVAQACVSPCESNGWTLNELDLSTPASPVVTTSRSNGAWDIGLASTMVLTTTSSGIAVWDRSPSFPDLGGSPTEGDADDLDVEGALGVFANGMGGLIVFDLSDPSTPVELSRVEVGGWADEVRIAGSVAVVLVSGLALATVDLSDPADPQVVGSLPLDVWSTSTEHLAVDSNLAMVTGKLGSQSSFLIVDISDPAAPSPLDSTVIGPSAQNDTAAFLDGAVALTSYRNTLVTYDVSGPATAILDSIEVDPFNEIFSVAVVGDVAFAATGFDLVAVDISDPSDMSVAETFDTIEAVNVGAVGGGLLAVQTVSDGTLLGDFGNLGVPVLAAAPKESRWWEAGRVMGDVWLRPSGPYLDLMSLECRAPGAGFRWWGLERKIWFENLGLYQITSSSWDFGDGAVSSPSGNTTSHVYDQPGRYSVTLEVVGPGGTDTASIAIEVGTRIFFDDFETRDAIGWDGWEPPTPQ